jgi:hypothetical protein
LKFWSESNSKHRQWRVSGTKQFPLLNSQTLLSNYQQHNPFLGGTNPAGLFKPFLGMLVYAFQDLLVDFF